jgi:hypothetical protein
VGFQLAPVFPSTDLDRTAAFWTGLGFVEIARYDGAGYLILEHPMGLLLHFGVDGSLRPTENSANAYLRFSTSEEAVALYEDWSARLPVGGEIRAPVSTFYGLVEWPVLDPDRNLIRVGG